MFHILDYLGVTEGHYEVIKHEGFRNDIFPLLLPTFMVHGACDRCAMTPVNINQKLFG